MKKEDLKAARCLVTTRNPFIFLLSSLFFLHLFLLFSFFIFHFPFVSAQSIYFTTPELLVPYIENAPEINAPHINAPHINAKAAVVVDAHTGALLYSKNPDMQIPPASLTKLVTMHLLLNEVKEGRASLDDIVPITEESWALMQPPRSSLMFLEPGQTVTLREILLGLAVSSGNDAAAAAALFLAPSIGEFAALMTSCAREMGLGVTRFTDASGYSNKNITTAEEFAFFCRRYIALHPDSLKNFHSVPVFAYPAAGNVSSSKQNNPGTIVQYNRNSLLESFPGVDGLKTGYIEESGYNIALTAHRGSPSEGTRFIAVILGAESERSRRADGEALLSYAFDNFKTVRPAAPEIENPRLWKGREDSVELVIAGEVDFTSPINRAVNLMHKTEINTPLIAPLPEGHHTGYLIFYDDLGELHRVPLVTVSDYERGNIFKRIWHTVMLFFNKF